MKIQIRSHRPDTAALAAWAAANHLGDPMTIRLPLTVDFSARTISVIRAHGVKGGEEDHPEHHPLVTDLPEAIMAKVGPSEADGVLAYPVVMV